MTQFLCSVSNHGLHVEERDVLRTLILILKFNTDVRSRHHRAPRLKNMEDAYSLTLPIELHRGQAIHCALFCTINCNKDLLATYLHADL
jgi:hypothetical protein